MRQPTAVFRAEAGSLRAYRGGNATARFALSMALRYLLKHPGRQAFYLGSLVHPSSYTLLSGHFGEVWPRREERTPPELLTFMDELATEFGLEKVEPSEPLVRRTGWRTRETELERDYWRHCDKPAARFFVESNAGYGEGHGLVTLVPLTVSNLLSMARSLVRRKLRQPLQAVVAGLQLTALGACLMRPEVLRRRIPRAALLALMESHEGLGQGMWRKFAERRFDDLAREVERYGHLGRQGRLAWLRRGEHRELAAREMLSLEAGDHVFVLSGGLELEDEGTWMATRGSMLLEVDRPLRVRAREATRLSLLPRREAREAT